TYTTTTAAGRRQATTLDARGRPVHMEVGATGASAPVDVTYDSSGRVARLTQDTEATTYEHDAAGRVSAIVAADGQRLELGWDGADRLVRRSYPGGRTYRYGYDADGVLTSRTLPSGTTHTFAPTGLEGEVSSWTPPGGQGAYGITRDEDELTTAVQSPSGAQRTVANDAGGRPTSLAFPGATRSATYAANVDRIAHYGSTAAPAGAAQSLDTVFDGTSLTTLTAAGLAPAQTTFAYSATTLQRTSSRLVSGADDVTLSYARDADGVLSGSGPFTYERNGPDHAVSAITDSTGRTEETVDRVAGLATRVLKVGGVEKYRLELTADATGRIVARHEVTAGGDHTYTYAHDAIGELSEVRRDGRLVETYGYNLDGDRTARGGETATYDAGGKLATRGTTTYGFDADGFLGARGADTFGYDRSGDLRSATAGATTVAYAYDGLGRRVARVEGGETTRYVYGDPDNPYRISAARSPGGVLDRYLYGPRGNLYAILRGSARFYVATDQIGSPRVVVDSAGTVVKRLEYDAYGVETDLDPSFFEPIGFAGGLRDPVTRLVRFGLRDYEPESGRFTARDPAGFAGSPRALYAYASNSPVSFRDPTGTFSLTWSGYEGLGGGLTIYIDPSAFFDSKKPLLTGMCFEGGVGLGGGFETDALEAAPTRTGLTGYGELGVKVPFVGGKIGGEFDLICGTGKSKAGVNLGPYQSGRDSEHTKSEGVAVDPNSLLATLAGTANAKIEGKAGLKLCLPPPPN
ncbi:MAG TPA: RHS repeat-associated core domain-containing protein, partial [Solirubrobacter sp.]|nr:RHS repeat-associated core domain-containing protein [Solirubrobacter sp.]